MEYKLSRREQKAMCIFWDAETALSIREFIQQDPSMKTSTAQSVLRSLLKKSYIRVAGIEQHNKAFARTYLPCFTKSDYIMDQLRSSAFTICGLFSVLVEKGDEETIQELQKMLDERKEQLQQEQQEGEPG